MIKDMKGVEIYIGAVVRVHTDHKIYTATVETLHPKSPTVLHSGFWVDIRVGNGVVGMMSYVLEVL